MDKFAVINVLQAVKSLPERERDIVTQRFGLVSGDPVTLEALSIKYGISRERVRQIENAALDRLAQVA